MNAYTYYQELDSRLEAVAVEANSLPMKKYMKNHFEFYGIKSPLRKKVISEFKKQHGLLDPEEIEEFVHLCWDNPYREVHYACMELIDKEKSPSVDRLELYEWMVLRRSWWDSVDFIAPTLMGKLFLQNPQLIADKTKDFVDSRELWLQRSALIFQLKYKTKTDLNLLFHYCERLAEHPDFFIRKAIGWSLRQAGKFYPNEIRDFVSKTSLSNLSRREALKHL